MIKKLSLFLFSVLFLVSANSINAQTSSPSGMVKTDRELARIKSLADQEITRRITSLNILITRISQMTKLSTESKNSLTSSANSQIADLTTLKMKIDAETNPENMKLERKSILTQYRIYMLFLPKVHILAAADRVNEIADIYEALSVKLQVQINQLNATGKDTKSLQNALNDMIQKYLDARVQAQNAINLVTPLAPDNGDPAKMNANKIALETSWKYVKNGMADLKAARSDVKTIRNSIKLDKPTPTPVVSTPSAYPAY